PQPAVNAPDHWVKPVLVAQVKFQEWTSDGSMRIPVYQGLRDDMQARDVHREMDGDLPAHQEQNKAREGRYFGAKAGSPDSEPTKAGGHTLQLTHRAKVFWPEEGITKGDLLDYYRQVAPFILPYLKDRPESLHRNPDGISKGDFF